MKEKKVIVVGAGLAGLAASKKLVDAGFQVQLLESRAVIGGKVSSWKDEDGDWVESGLHVFFGSYQKIFELMKEVGIYENVSWQTPSIQYRLPGGAGFQIVSQENWPSPLNLLPNFFFGHQFAVTDLINYCQAIIPVLRQDLDYIAAQDEISFAEWVSKFNVSETMMQRMFLPMTLSLKFLPMDQISAQVVLNVFRLFIANPKGFKIGFLNGSPAEKLTGPILQYLISQGASLELGKKVIGLQMSEDGGRLKALRVATGELYEADQFVFALPTHKFSQLLAPHFPGVEYFQNLHKFTGVPVANAQFWVDRPIMSDRRLHFGTAGHTPVFCDMNLACQGYRTKNGNSLIETVVAPYAPLQNMTDAEILDLVWGEIRSYFPKAAQGAQLLKASLVRIPHSVYAPYPGLEKYRPSQKTPVANMYLAGGVTKGHEFYDSMEGAVQSGYLAAEELLRNAAEKYSDFCVSSAP